jgi:hypothetical protein
MAAKNDLLKAMMNPKQQQKQAEAGSGAADAAAAGALPVSAAKPGFFGGLMDNPLFNAGAGIAVLGAIATTLRSSSKQILTLAKKQFSTSLEVTSKDHAYSWVLQWISTHAGSRATHLGVETRFARHESGKIDTTFGFVPGPGRHWFWYDGRLITVHRERDPSVIDFKNGSPWESVRLTTFGRSRDVFTTLLNEAKTLALQKEEGHTLIYTMGHITMTHEAKWEYAPLPSAVPPSVAAVVYTWRWSVLQAVRSAPQAPSPVFGGAGGGPKRAHCGRSAGVHVHSEVVPRPRHSVSPRLSVVWPAGLWQNLFHCSARRSVAWGEGVLSDMQWADPHVLCWGLWRVQANCTTTFAF